MWVVTLQVREEGRAQDALDELARVREELAAEMGSASKLMDALTALRIEHDGARRAKDRAERRLAAYRSDAALARTGGGGTPSTPSSASFLSPGTVSPGTAAASVRADSRKLFSELAGIQADVASVHASLTPGSIRGKYLATPETPAPPSATPITAAAAVDGSASFATDADLLERMIRSESGDSYKKL